MSDERSIYVANFHQDVNEDLLEELFTQAGPVVKVVVRDVRDSTAKFALVEFEDEASVLFSIELMDGVKLFGVPIQVKPRNNTNQEAMYRRKRSEIMDRQRSAPTTPSSQDHRRRSYESGDRDRERDREWDRDRDRSRSGSQRDYQRRDRDPLPPPPPPPGGSWRNDRHSTPQLLPHQQFVQHMMQQQHRSAPSSYQPRHFQPPPPPPPPQQFQTPHRGQDRRGYDRQGYSGRHGERGGRY